MAKCIYGGDKFTDKDLIRTRIFRDFPNFLKSEPAAVELGRKKSTFGPSKLGNVMQSKRTRPPF